MEKTNEKIASANAREDIIVLGVASIETKGGGEDGEPLGENFGGGISDK